MNKEETSKKAFLEGPVSKTVFRNVIPAMLSTLMILIYNLADTFFIGQTHNDHMVAAVSLATPVFLIFMSIGTLFGVGGSSVIARALGEERKDYACKVSSFCTWVSAAVGISFMLIIWIFATPIVKALGASTDTLEYTRTYLCLITIGGVFTILSGCWSNIIRAEGNPSAAMWGNLIGNIINIILDPVFILGLNMGVAGAAIVTSFGNIVGCLIYLGYILKGKFSLSIRLKDFSAKDKICSGVLSIGVPAALTSLLMSISQIIANSLIAFYGDMALAAYGIAGKIRMCFSSLGNGMGHGVQPVLGYCYGAKEKKRFKDVLTFSTIFSVVLFSVISVLCLIFTEPIVNLFLTDASALEYGVLFTRIILSSAFFMGTYCVLMGALQAIGAAKSSLIAAISRQGIVYIPVLFILRAAWGLNGLVIAEPVAEYISLVLVLILVIIAVKKMQMVVRQKKSFSAL
ncbi:MAG: MATE family efflux transporter [Candidatus Ornithomonoglobus sp.]